jgi:metallophosphoesterase (TIGR00282 family)
LNQEEVFFMELNVLAVGDVVGEAGVDYLSRRLPGLRRSCDAHFTVVNGENAASNGLLPRQADEIFSAGADVITMGNHTWDKQQIVSYMEENQYIIRPANYTSRAPGRGFGVFDGPRGVRIRVVNLIGRCEMDANFDNPFTKMDEILSSDEADLTLVDFHGEATSEKRAMGWYLDGRVQALWGTHTHVPTADCEVLPKGLGYVTDLGMTGPAHSVIGVKPQQAINRFLGGLPQRFQPAEGPRKLNAVLFTIDTNTRRCLSVRRVDSEE